MQAFFPFFIILLVAVIVSQLFSRMRIPWVVALILGGIVVGPNGFNWFQPDATIDFLATIGLVFLMFMAGLESRLSDIKGLTGKIMLVGGFVGLIPTIVGYGVATALGYGQMTSILLGIIFMSSAIALLIPTLEEHNILNSDLGKTVVASAIIIDAISLVLLSIFLQFASTGGPTTASLLVYPFVIGALALFAYTLPKLRWLALSGTGDESQDIFERELRFMLFILIGLVVFFEFVGLHAIIAGFFGGMILSKTMTSTLLKAKLHAISYGFFVPVFFVVVGAATDLSIFTEGFRAFTVTFIVITSLVLSKFLSGWTAGKLAGFDSRSSAFIGTAVMPQLSTALAVAFLGFGEGLLDQSLLSAIIGLTIVTSVVGPIFTDRLGRRIVTLKPNLGTPQKETIEQ